MKLMTVRDFVRGGYKSVTEEVVIMRNLEPIGVWKPISDGKLPNGEEKRSRRGRETT